MWRNGWTKDAETKLFISVRTGRPLTRGTKQTLQKRLDHVGLEKVRKEEAEGKFEGNAAAEQFVQRWIKREEKGLAEKHAKRAFRISIAAFLVSVVALGLPYARPLGRVLESVYDYQKYNKNDTDTRPKRFQQ